MSDEAEVILEGTIIAVRYDVPRTVEVGSAPPTQIPFTAWTMEISDALRGELAGTVDLAYAGGSFDGTHWLELAEAPTFAIGERVLIHAVADGSGAYRMIDWTLGILRQRLASDGTLVTVDGTGRPVVAVVCDAEPLRDGSLDAAALWTEVVSAVSDCAATSTVGGVR